MSATANAQPRLSGSLSRIRFGSGGDELPQPGPRFVSRAINRARSSLRRLASREEKREFTSSNGTSFGGDVQRALRRR
jgi:hypothetical protein